MADLKEKVDRITFCISKSGLGGTTKVVTTNKFMWWQASSDIKIDA
ncbi:hypothetical protein [Arenibacter hampyeongensis]|nr:hypothetical protein [Arenibacter hampyeongensis]